MPQTGRWTLVVLCLGVAAGGLRARDAREREGLELFEREVRPLLVESCYRCHSSKRRAKAGLELDSRAGWTKGGERGPAVVPGRPEDSLLFRAVEYQDPDLQMPPKRKLSAQRIAAIRRWIELGAPDPRAEPESAVEGGQPDPPAEAGAARDHWVWQALRKREPPEVARADWPRDGVDRFVLARMERAGLEAAPPAGRSTWLRRVSFALTGLPPSLAEVAAFLADKDDGAFERVADRLLESPHFGERWAQHWLDLVRYAESRGHEGDFAIPEAWRYRDYVIRAFGRDVPYDELVTEHVAGDLLKEPRLDPETGVNESVQGTGFWHLGAATHSPVDIRGDEAERVADQIDVFGKAFLGLTVGCARCHDHKFDAISAEDYYALAGYLQSSSYHLYDASDPRAQRAAAHELAELRRDRVPVVAMAWSASMRERIRRLPVYAATASTLSASKSGANEDDGVHAGGLDPEVLAAWHTFLTEGKAGRDFPRLASTGGRPETEASDGVVSDAVGVVFDAAGVNPHDWIVVGERFGHGPVPAGEVLIGSTPERPVRAVTEWPAARADMLSERLSGMLRTKTFEVNRGTVWYRYRGQADVFLAVDSHRMVAGPLHGVVRQKLKASEEWTWQAHRVGDYVGHRVHVEFTPGPGFALAEVRLSDERPQASPRPRLHAGDAPPDWSAIAAELDRVLVELTGGRVVGAGAAEAASLVNWLIAHEALLDRAPKAEAVAGEKWRHFVERRGEIESGIPQPIRVLALVDGSGENERVHIRGSHRSLAEVPVPRRLLAAIEARAVLPERGSGRLELARAMTSPRNPLLPRVWVNRIWHHLFGSGIVPTVDDFGKMGEPPSHPELLDWLAADLVNDGWSTKRLLRRLVLSSTYRTSSRLPSRAAEIDPRNILLSHTSVRRLDAEAIRDALLSVSGRLDRRLYGPSVMVEITEFMRGNRSPGGSGPVDGDGRRSIYVRVLRNHVSHFLAAFDRPSPSATLGRRGVSNSPAQPLLLMNDPLVHGQAELWASRLLKEAEREGRTAAATVERAWLEAFGRPAEAGELEESLAFLGVEGRDAPASATPIVSWIELCHTLFNVKEFIYLN